MARPKLHYPALCRLVVGLGVLCACAFDCHADSRDRGEPRIKAGFLYNFMKHTEWPETARERILCVGARALPDDALAGIDRLPLHDGLLAVRVVQAPEDTHACHALLLGRQQRANLNRWLNAVAMRPVLTIGDLAGIDRPSTMINLFTEGRRVRYDLNLAPARHVGLKFNPRLINLADTVYEE